MISTATNTPGRFAGLTLKAWAVFYWNGAPGITLIKGFNVASVVRNSIGNFTVTLSTPLAGLTGAIVDYSILNDQNGTLNSIAFVISSTTILIGNHFSGTPGTDPVSPVYVAIYE